MKMLRISAMSLMMLTSPAGWAQSDAQKALDRFKAMLGTWVGKRAQGQPSQVIYRLMARGDFRDGGEHHGRQNHDQPVLCGRRSSADDALLCPSNNQPRMRTTISPDGKTVSFDFLDATNLASPQAGHMHRAVYVFPDPEHYSEDWTWKREGKDAHFQFALQRKK